MTIASSFEQQMLALINQERAAFGIAALRLNAKLNGAAENHSRWMLDTDIFSHTGVNQSSPHERTVSAGFVYAGNWVSGENIAVQTERGAAGWGDDVLDLHHSLMNSPGHRANILGPRYAEIGIGIEIGDFLFGGVSYRSVIVTQNFALSAADNGGTGPQQPPVAGGIGNSNPNRITGTAEPDRLDGRGGNDTLSGQGGNDVLLGRTGSDTLLGGAGNDTITGGEQNDSLSGGADNDRLDGGDQDDLLNGGMGNDLLSGGAGADAFSFSKQFGKDRIADFADDQDMIIFGSGPWDGAMTVRTFIDTYARSTQGDVVFSFGNGQRLVVSDVASVAQLYDDVMFSA